MIEAQEAVGPGASPPAGRPVILRARAAAGAIGRSRTLLLAALVAALFAYMAITSTSTFVSSDNFAAVLLNMAQFGILAIGMMILMIAGQFDLSVGGVLALAGVVAGLLVQDHGTPAAVAFALGIAVGGLCGLINGLVVSRLRINALIATLATVGIYRGVTQLLSGTGVSSIGHDFQVFGQTKLLGLQLPFWIMLVLVVLAMIALGKLKYFQRFYYVGGSAKAAARLGINVEQMVLVGFIITGLLAGLAGVLLASRLNNAVITAGTGVELQVITAVVLGGASLKGGVGTIQGAILGVVFIALVQNALILKGVDVFWQGIVIGVVLLFAVAIDMASSQEDRE